MGCYCFSLKSPCDISVCFILVCGARDSVAVSLPISPSPVFVSETASVIQIRLIQGLTSYEPHLPLFWIKSAIAKSKVTDWNFTFICLRCSRWTAPNEKKSQKSLSLSSIKFIDGEFVYNRYHLWWNLSVITHHYDEKVLVFIKGYFFDISKSLFLFSFLINLYFPTMINWLILCVWCDLLSCFDHICTRTSSKNLHPLNLYFSLWHCSDLFWVIILLRFSVFFFCCL